MLWKIYFWFIALVAGYFAFGNLATWSGSPPLDIIIAQLLNVVAVVGLYGYVYKKQIGPIWFWQLFILVFILIPLAYTVNRVYVLRSDEDLGLRMVGTLLTVLPFVPMYIGLYRYAFKQKR